MPGACLSHQIEDKWRVDGRLLSRFEIAESLDVLVEAHTYFFKGGFIR
jgi:hypothetical protein